CGLNAWVNFFFLFQCPRGSFVSQQNACLPCNCKGHADYCEDITGICIVSIAFRLTGDFCEMCEDGYILSSRQDGLHACVPCSCPLAAPSNNFAVYCKKGISTVQCKCKEGYAGNHCERCAPGYYGNPMLIGSSCKRCDCNGNTDPNLIFNECHNVTGRCQHCWGNTAGASCERCAPGFYGDAISAKNCRECDCESGHCNMHTGECLEEKRFNVSVDISLLPDCDDCIWQLIRDLTLSNKTLDQLKVGVLNISTGAAANDRLKYYNYTAHHLQVNQQYVVLFLFLSRKKKLMISQGRVPSVQEILSRFSSRLSEARDFLLSAAGTVQEAEDKNRASLLKFQRKEVISPALCSWNHTLSLLFDQNALYHAEIDGASQKLTEKTERLSQVDRDLVQKADDHAAELERLAYELEEDLKEGDANGFVQRAISAANVYNNIVKYIDDANITSLTTLNLSQRAEDVCCPSLFAFHTNFCSCSRICPAVENLNVLVPELLDKLKVVEEKKPVNNVTTNILRIRELIAQARSVAKKVQVSMKFTGRSSVEVHPPSNPEELKTVTSISLFMRVDPDKDPIEDRFILYLGDRSGRKDYMGLAIKNDKLVFVYNLGRDDVEIPLTSKPVSQWPAVFNYIKVERLGRHGKVFLTIPSQGSTDEQKFIQKGEAPIADSLFDIDPKNLVFFIGGVPPDIKLPPPLSLAPFVGCIELASINNDVISLYNFKETHFLNIADSPPCPRYKLAFSQSRIASYLFDGTGYGLVSNIERRAKFGQVIRFDISVRTITNNCTIFLMVNGKNFFLLEMKNGFLRLTYDFSFSNGPKLLENNSPKYQINDAKYHEVSVIYHMLKKVILLVDKALVKTVENPQTPLPFSDIYIGGAPSSVLKSRPELSSVVGLKGCVKGFLFQKKDFNLLEEPGTVGISSGCPEELMSREASFSGHSYLGSTAKISPFDNFEGGLNFRTLQPSGLLFYHAQGSDEFSIALENGAVTLNHRGSKVSNDLKRSPPTAKSSSDSPIKTFYYGGSPSSSLKNFTGCISHAYISRQDRDIEGEDFQKYTEKMNVSLENCPIQRPPAALMSHHRGSSKAKQNKSSHLPELPSSNLESSEPNSHQSQSCHLSPRPRSTRQAFHYGGVANSRQHYEGIPDSLSERCHLSLSLKMELPFGLIFYASDVQEDNFMALFVADGKLVFSFSVGDQKVQIRSEENYDDGAWHSIVCVRDGSKGRLTIDRLTEFEDVAQANNVAWRVSDSLFVGGVPPGKAQRNIQRNSAYSFTGCLKNLQLDGRRLSSVAESFGVGPCFEGLSEDGTYFSEEGGYVVLDESFELGLRFELTMEVRPRVASAVLLHVRTAGGYFIMYIHQGAVVVVVHDGKHKFSTKVSPRHGVCDGSWHRITVIRDANVVQLDVDSEIKHVVGPVNRRSTDTRKPIFIGGAPGEKALATAPWSKVTHFLTDFLPASFSKTVLVIGAVSVGSCPGA
uniref:Laminin, alpha 4 n=1 Tax=Xiphophorus couchianus TaxID=32473 RepID=A0A3B5LJZ4_9TELE